MGYHIGHGYSKGTHGGRISKRNKMQNKPKMHLDTYLMRYHVLVKPTTNECIRSNHTNNLIGQVEPFLRSEDFLLFASFCEFQYSCSRYLQIPSQRWRLIIYPCTHPYTGTRVTIYQIRNGVRRSCTYSNSWEKRFICWLCRKCLLSLWLL